MSYRIRFTEAAENCLVRRYAFVLARSDANGTLTERALQAVRHQREEDYH